MENNNDKVYERGWIYSIRYRSHILYVGSTIDFEDRKRQHKYRCYNLNNPKSNYKIYKIMRSFSNNFDDFEFKIEDILVNIIILDLKKPEDYYMDLLKPIGNDRKVRPEIQIHRSDDMLAYQRDFKNLPDNKEKIKQHRSKPWFCEYCHSSVTTDHKSRHLKTNKHIENFILY